LAFFCSHFPINWGRKRKVQGLAEISGRSGPRALVAGGGVQVASGSIRVLHGVLVDQKISPVGGHRLATLTADPRPDRKKDAFVGTGPGLAPGKDGGLGLHRVTGRDCAMKSDIGPAKNLSRPVPAPQIQPLARANT
jgi:hypothetical protein